MNEQSDPQVKAWETANHKYFQWHALDYMADDMNEELRTRRRSGKATDWLDYDDERLLRAKGRIERAVNAVDCPEFQRFDEFESEG
jgi:hypothetical protein